jgi:hypothetical protein
MRRERNYGTETATTDNRPLTTDGQIENLLKEVLAKQDFLLVQLQELRKTQLATTSEMKSNYVANDAMLRELLGTSQLLKGQVLASNS